MRRWSGRSAIGALALIALLTAACSEGGSSSAPAASAAKSIPAPGATTGSTGTASGSGPRIVAAGDLVCAFGTKVPPIQLKNGHTPTCNARPVSRLVHRGNYDAFLPLGDLQYSYGGYWRYKKYWDHYYGDLVKITRPAPGNHEGYADFTGYVKYFGPKITHMPARVGEVHIGGRVGKITGYYSYQLGDWHMIALNSQLCMNKMWNLRTGWTNPIRGGGCDPNDPQMRWLKKDLAAHPDGCSLAYFHHARFRVTTFDGHGNDVQAPLVDALAAGGVDVILTGHEHDYQRWGPIDAAGNADPNGFVQFVVGTGGDSYQPLPDQSTWPDVVKAAHTGSYGALEMQLNSGGYNFSFVSAPGEKPYADAGTGTCY